jgi:hypothetical protein
MQLKEERILLKTVLLPPLPQSRLHAKLLERQKLLLPPLSKLLTKM